MTEVKQLGGHRFGAKSVTFSPDHRRVATGGMGNEGIRLIDWETELQLLTLGADAQSPDQEMRFSENGNLLGLRTGQRLFIWRAPSWEEIDRAEARRLRP